MVQVPLRQLWRIWRRSLLRVALVGVVAGLSPAVAHANGADGIQLAQPDVPATLQVPAGNVLLFRAFAAGTQQYACVRADSGATSWTFRQPRAILLDDNGEPLGIHGRGPFWASYDGSRIVGSAPISAPGRDPAHDIPLLLLRSTPDETDGQFAPVRYIQRLDTRGGAAPAGPCDPGQQPALAVPYLAVYYFYGPAPATVGQTGPELVGG